MNSWRYTLNFEIPKENKGTDGLRKYFAEIFQEMTNYCQSICLLPWDADDYSNKITDSEKLPHTITQLQKYFSGARPQDQGGYVFSRIRLGFPVQTDRKTFEADIQGWCKNRSIRLFEASVQHANVRSCGWLVYMPRTVNQKRWSE